MPGLPHPTPWFRFSLLAVAFTLSQVRRALPEKVLKQWEEADRKAALEALKESGFADIVRCIHCCCVCVFRWLLVHASPWHVCVSGPVPILWRRGRDG